MATTAELIEQTIARVNAGERLTGTALEPKVANPGDRYCYMCDEWMRAKVCKACGLDTEKAAK